VLQSLAIARLVVAQRGPSGGFSLARAPETISVYEVLQAVDPLKRILTCPLNLDTHREGLCRVHAHMDRALALVEQAFREATIADLLDPEGPLAACPPRRERALHS
jgi:Rrf2 family protein